MKAFSCMGRSKLKSDKSGTHNHNYLHTIFITTVNKNNDEITVVISIKER